MFVRVAAVTNAPEIRDIENNKDIAWSLRPIILLFQCVGVQLGKTNNKKGLIKKRLVFSYGIVCLLLNLVNQMDLARFLHQSVIETSEMSPNWTVVASWNNIIDLANYSVHNLGSHLVLFFIIRQRWIALADSLKRFQFKNLFLIKIRRFCIAGITYTSVLVNNPIICKFTV